MQFPWQGIPAAENKLIVALKEAGFVFRQRPEHFYVDIDVCVCARVSVICTFKKRISGIACTINNRTYQISEKFPNNVIKSLRKMQKQAQEKSHG